MRAIHRCTSWRIGGFDPAVRRARLKAAWDVTRPREARAVIGPITATNEFLDGLNADGYRVLYGYLHARCSCLWNRGPDQGKNSYRDMT
jgi:hypothetical protein